MIYYYKYQSYLSNSKIYPGDIKIFCNLKEATLFVNAHYGLFGSIYECEDTPENLNNILNGKEVGKCIWSHHGFI